MRSIVTRRSFIKGIAGTACSIAAASSLARAASALKKGEPIATLLDLSKCKGCGQCVDSCRKVNAEKFPKPVKPFPEMYPDGVQVEDWSDRTDVSDRLTPYNWLYIQSASVSVAGEDMMVNIPRRCMHCMNPPCVKLCPWGAAVQLDNGISRIDSEICLGGAKCRSVCPWHIPQRQTGVGLYLDLMPSFAGNGVMYKCDRCYDRVARGEMPVCIQVCPENVQSIGPRDEIVGRAHELAAEKGGYIYGELENGGTDTIYVSPAPFDNLDRAVEKGEGRPGLKGVSNRMKIGTTLAMAMVIAPFAGVAGALAKFYRRGKQDD